MTTNISLESTNFRGFILGANCRKSFALFTMYILSKQQQYKTVLLI